MRSSVRASLPALAGSAMGRWLENVFAQHSHNLRYNPVLAHYEAAVASTAVGCVLAVARGAFVSLTQPPGQRLLGFRLATQAVAPLYIIPFVLGSQFDCYRFQWSQKNGYYEPPVSHEASHLG